MAMESRAPSMSLLTVYRRALGLLAVERPLFLLVCGGNLALAILIRDADLILVLEDGVIVEQGRYDDLLLRDGAFARLARAGEFVEMHAEGEETQGMPPERLVARAASA